MKRSLLLIAVCLLLAAGAGIKWFTSVMVEGLPVPGEVPGEISVYKEVNANRPLSIAEVSQLPETAFAVREDCCEFGSPQGPIWLRFKCTNDSTLPYFDKEKTAEWHQKDRVGTYGSVYLGIVKN